MAFHPFFWGWTQTGVAHFAAQAEDPELALNQDLCAIDLRSIALQGLADNSYAGRGGAGAHLLHWHTRHRFCANCGACHPARRCRLQAGVCHVRQNTFRAPTRS
jgi:NADH pyrophosphatase NudC (nudix superfamily)